MKLERDFIKQTFSIMSCDKCFSFIGSNKRHEFKHDWKVIHMFVYLLLSQNASLDQMKEEKEVQVRLLKVCGTSHLPVMYNVYTHIELYIRFNQYNIHVHFLSHCGCLFSKPLWLLIF